MKNLIPILSIIVAAACLAVSIAGNIMMCVTVRAESIGYIAVPTAIVGAVSSGIAGVLAAVFVKSKLCRIAAFIDLASFLLSAASIIIWFCAY